MAANIDMIKKVYSEFGTKLGKVRKVLNRPLTYAEKILYTHLWEDATKELKRGKDYSELSFAIYVCGKKICSSSFNSSL